MFLKNLWLIVPPQKIIMHNSISCFYGLNIFFLFICTYSFYDLYFKISKRFVEDIYFLNKTMNIVVFSSNNNYCIFYYFIENFSWDTIKQKEQNLRSKNYKKYINKDLPKGYLIQKIGGLRSVTVCVCVCVCIYIYIYIYIYYTEIWSVTKQGKSCFHDYHEGLKLHFLLLSEILPFGAQKFPRNKSRK